MPIKGLNSSVSSLQIFLANGYTLYYKYTVLYSQGQAREFLELRFTLKSEAAIPTSSLSFIQDLNAHLQLSTTSLNWQLFFLLQLRALHIHTSYLSFFVHGQDFSSQNFKNYTLSVKLHIVCKPTH